MMKRRCNKTQSVLEYLQKNSTITSWEAIELFGATRLSAIIYNLRKEYLINSIDETIIDKYGNSATFKRYIYCGELATA